MTKTQQKKFEQQLINRRAELTELVNMSKASADTVVLDQSMVGRLSRMDAMQAQAMSVETNRRRQQELGEIERALRDILSNQYGYCVECDELISIKRLEINLTASLCIKCAEELG